MLDAVCAQGGLRLITQSGEALAPVPVVAHPGEIDWRPDDIVLLTMKSNHTAAALEDLAAAGVWRQWVVCAQNGVANEALALRFFANVAGMLLMMPAQYTVPGEVVAPGAPRFGLFDLGRYPDGPAEGLEPLGRALDAAGFDCLLRRDIMVPKYGKLLMNLRNIVGAALGESAGARRWDDAARDEGVAVLAAAGIPHEDVGAANPRRALMKTGRIPGRERAGSSSTQSLLRGTGSIETEYLNGEVVRLARLHGVAAPVNAALVRVSREMVAKGMAVGSYPEADLERLVAACLAEG